MRRQTIFLYIDMSFLILWNWNFNTNQITIFFPWVWNSISLLFNFELQLHITTYNVIEVQSWITNLLNFILKEKKRKYSLDEKCTGWFHRILWLWFLKQSCKNSDKLTFLLIIHCEKVQWNAITTLMRKLTLALSLSHFLVLFHTVN